MFRAMREKMKLIMWILVFAFVASIFLVWGMHSLGPDGRGLPDAVAKVNSEKIGINEYYATLRRYYEHYRALYGEKFTDEIAEKLNLKKQALNDLIEQRLLLQEARGQGIRVTAEELRRRIEGYAVFQTEGKFDQRKYLEILRLNRIDPATFEESEKASLTIRKLIDRIQDAVKITDKEVRDSFRAANEQVKASHILIKVPPEASKEVDAKARAKAEEILKQLKNGANFASLAKRYSEDPAASKGGDLGFISRGETTPEFEKVLFSLKKGEVSGLVRTPYGYHLIKSEGKKENKKEEQEFLEKKGELSELFLRQKKIRVFREWFETLRNSATIVDNLSKFEGTGK